MISYPLQEYVSSKKDDDYRQTLTNKSDSSESFQHNCFQRFRLISICFVLIILVWICYCFIPTLDPTCFQTECTKFVCNAYQQGLIGGRLCPDLCTTKTLHLESCLGQHQHFRSRLFDDNQGNQVIRCYLKYPLTQSNPSNNFQDIFTFPHDETTFQQFSQTLITHIQTKYPLNNVDSFVDQLIQFADFNRNDQLSLSEARSLWSLVQIDEFLNSILFAMKSYTPAILGSCGHLFSIEKLANPQLPINQENELNLDRPNWFQRVRLAIGIIEFVDDITHYQDTDQHLFLCRSIFDSFGYDKHFEAKIIKMNSLYSSKSILSRLPSTCRSNDDCSFDCSQYSFCNRTTNTCQIHRFSSKNFNDLCLLVSNLVRADANSTFIEQFQILFDQCQQIIQDEHFAHETSFDFISFQIRQTILLQNFKNLLWSHIEYQMDKITRKPMKKSTRTQSSNLIQ